MPENSANTFSLFVGGDDPQEQWKKKTKTKLHAFTLPNSLFKIEITSTVINYFAIE